MAIRCGDCLAVMSRCMEENSVDAVVCDPPYGLEFMGKEWDRPWAARGKNAAGAKMSRGGFVSGNGYTNRKTPTYGKVWSNRRCTKCGHIASGGSPCQCDEPEWITECGSVGAPNRAMQDWHEAWATEALRVLKPSHYLMAFGGTRTWHRLACAIEDAGFEIRDTLMWLYGSGFPKGKTCLKPAWEPIILARKPGPKRELGIEECRVGTDDVLVHGGPLKTNSGDTRVGAALGMMQDGTPNIYVQSPAGRWPANLVLDEEAGAMLDGQTGTKKSGSRTAGVRKGLGYHGADGDGGPAIVGDSGGASRFFYCAKASRSERNAGCEGLKPKVKDADYRQPTGDPLVDRIHGCGVKATNHHPTVKPLALMRWLVKLVAQPGDVVLDPFMGSGSTGVACVMEGRKFLGIDQDAEYVEISRRRIAHARLEKTPATP